MTKFLASTIIAATIAFTAAPARAQMSALTSLKTPATATSTDSAIIHKTGGRRHRFAVGLALGIAGAAAASHAYHYSAHRHHWSRHDHRWSRHERRCRRWSRLCYLGKDRACWKYDTRC